MGPRNIVNRSDGSSIIYTQLWRDEVRSEAWMSQGFTG